MENENNKERTGYGVVNLKYKHILYSSLHTFHYADVLHYYEFFFSFPVYCQRLKRTIILHKTVQACLWSQNLYMIYTYTDLYSA